MLRQGRKDEEHVTLYFRAIRLLSRQCGGTLMRWHHRGGRPGRALFTKEARSGVSQASHLRIALREAGNDAQAVEQVVFYEKPLIKLERLLTTYLGYAPRGFPVVPRRHAGLVEGKTVFKKCASKKS